MSTLHAAMTRPLLRALVAALCLCFAQNATAAFFGNAVEAANLFRNAMHEGEIATALRMLAPEVLIVDAGRLDRSREAYAAGALKRDIAHFGAHYVEVLSQGMRSRLAPVRKDMAPVRRKLAPPRSDLAAVCSLPVPVSRPVVLLRSSYGDAAHLGWR